MTESRSRARALAVVTGGSRGIGEHVVRALLADTDVLNISREPARTDSEAAAGAGARLYDLCLDLSQTEVIRPMLDDWFAEHPGHEVTLLIHNAAVLNPGRLDRVTAAQALQSWQVNVHAPLELTGSLTNAERFSRDGGRVVYVVSSLARPLAELSFASIGLYSTTKAALSRLALIQRREFELSGRPVEVFRVHPGIVDTDLQRELRADPDADPAFGAKTADLPAFRTGDWDGRLPAERMRTVTAGHAADFVVWVARHAAPRAEEYDFYHERDFHRMRSASPAER